MFEVEEKLWWYKILHEKVIAEINSFANGISRIFWGWISDKVGRYKTMGIVPQS